MNRREFLKSLLGAAAIAAIPPGVLAAAETEVAPLADSFATWTPSNYVFSTWIRRTAGLQKPIWERHAFAVSKEIGDALSGNTIHTTAGYLCLQRVLQTVGQEQGEMYGARLELCSHSSPQFSADWSDSPENRVAYRHENLISTAHWSDIC